MRRVLCYALELAWFAELAFLSPGVTLAYCTFGTQADRTLRECLFWCVCVRVYVCVSVCGCARVSARACVRLLVPVCMCECHMSMCVHVCVCVSACVRVSVCVFPSFLQRIARNPTTVTTSLLQRRGFTHACLGLENFGHIP